jgi:signal transduction histidine kinase
MFAELRRTVAGLRSGGPTARSPLRLADLGSAVRPAEQAGLEVGAEIAVHSALPGAVEAAIYRIVQESITNVVKHANASRVSVQVREVGNRVEVSIVDDGTAALSPSADGAEATGTGLTGMRERAHLLGGTFDARAGESGFAVRATIPVEVPS